MDQFTFTFLAFDSAPVFDCLTSNLTKKQLSDTYRAPEAYEIYTVEK